MRVLCILCVVTATTALGQETAALFHDSFEDGTGGWRPQGDGFETAVLESDYDDDNMLRLDNSKGTAHAFIGVRAGPPDSVLVMSFAARAANGADGRVGVHRYGGPIVWRDVGTGWRRVEGRLRSHPKVAQWYVVVPAGGVVCIDDVTLAPFSMSAGEKTLQRRHHRREAEIQALTAYDALDHVLPRTAGPQVTDRRYPIGFYITRKTADRDLTLDAIFRELADAGVTLAHNSDFEDWPEHTDRYEEINSNAAASRYLQRAAAEGIDVIMGIDRMMVKNESLEEIRERVRAMRDEKGLYGWYLMDEPTIQGVAPETLRQAYAAVKDQDPHHPVITTICRPERVADYAGATDVIVVDNYPVSVEPLFNLAVPVETALAATGGETPIWAAIQVVNIDLHRIRRGGEISHLISNPRGPTVEEVRCMTYLAIAHGASGILFFAYDGVFMGGVYDKPEFYQGVLDLVREIRSFSKMLRGDCLAKGTVNGRDKTRVSYLIRKNREGKTLLVAVNAFNRSSGPVTIPMPQRDPVSVSLDAHEVLLRSF